MQVSYAEIVVAYMAVFGEKWPDDMPYGEAGAKVRAKRPDDWRWIFQEAGEALKVHGSGSYDRAACDVRAAFHRRDDEAAKGTK